METTTSTYGDNRLLIVAHVTHVNGQTIASCMEFYPADVKRNIVTHITGADYSKLTTKTEFGINKFNDSFLAENYFNRII